MATYTDLILTLEQYKKIFDERLVWFQIETEATATEFANRELEYFESALYAIEHPEGLEMDSGMTGYNYFKNEIELILEHGKDKLYYSTNRKIDFLKSVDIDYSEKSKHNPETNSKYPFDPNNLTTVVILEHFEQIDQKGWEYAFRSEEEFKLFVGLLTEVLEKGIAHIGNLEIRTKKGSKTRLGSTLGIIHSEISNNDNLSTDRQFMQVVRSLEPFSSLSNDQLYKILTRHGRS